MPSDNPIQVDASTVQRARALADESASNPSPGMLEDDQLSQAKTVIRGSTGDEPVLPGLDPLHRTPSAVAQVLLGQRLNHFRLDEMIGGGGMGAVFRAHDEQLGRTVAIKVIPFVGHDPDLQRRFRNEAQSAARLDHPRIARVFDAGSQGDWHYIVFEYIEGTNIRDLVAKSGVFSIDDAVFCTSQLADALQHASDRGIVHRDIKPSNVLIGAEGLIKLVDMGLARSENLDLSEDMTATGVTLGTFDYISPEQAHDPRDADLRSDIYSLGCTLYFMLTGAPPYPGGTMLQKLLSHGNAPPPDTRVLRPEVSDSLAAVIAKMLAKKPADRYQTASDLIADLREVAFRDGLTRSQTLGPVTIAPVRPLVLWLERHAPWLVAAMLLLMSAAWLQLESAAFHQEMVIPSTVQRPTSVSQPSSPVSLDESAVRDTVPRIPSAPSQEQVGTESKVADAASDQQTMEFGPPEEPPKLGVVNTPGPWIEPSNEIRSIDSTPGRRAAEEREESSLADARGSADSRGTSEGIEPVAINVIRIVSPNTVPSFEAKGSGIATTTTLGAALELATQHASTSRIEIAVPILVCNEPVRLDVDDLLITSTIGGSAIVFQPNGSPAMERSKMFAIGAHPVVFEDLHFVWNVPSSDLNGGTLFELHDNKLVRMTDCTVTVSNPTLRDEVYAFDVMTDPNRLPRSKSNERDAFPEVGLELNNTVVRGQMTMLHMDYAANLSLDWDNGLLSVSQRMIDTAGARLEPAAAAGPIQLKLWRVTVHAPEGIFLMRVGVSGPFPVSVDRLAHECVFLVNSGVPHFDFRGLSSLPGVSPLRLQGASNAYVTDLSLSDPILRLLTTDQQLMVTQIDEMMSAAVPWAVDKSPRWTVNWSKVPDTSIPASQRTPVNYRQRDESPLGFDEKSLPPMPESYENMGDAVRAALKSVTGGVEL